MRKWFLVTAVVAALVAVPVAVAVLTSGTLHSSLDLQRGRHVTGTSTLASTTFHTITGLSATLCSKGEVSATLSVSASGGPVRFRILQDGGPVMKPGTARFVPPAGGGSFSFTFMNNTATFEANDKHGFEVQWRTEGTPVTITNGDVNYLYQKGTRAC
ncbi:MAG TPA: hypothetical protein VH306_01435 [Gaiellaceae bacterium]|jgi:hypothetical protein